MTQPLSVHIVGRGIVGLATAFACQQLGAHVAVVGPRERPGSASAAAVGSSTLKGNIQASSPLFALKLRAHQQLPAWLAAVEAASGCRIDQHFGGAYEPFFSAKDYVFLRDRVCHRQLSGCFNLRVVGTLSLRERWRGVFPETARGAFFFHQDGWFHPQQCLAALETALRRGGAQFIDEPVLALQPGQHGPLLALGSGPVQTTAVLLAAGVFCDELLAASGLQAPLQDLAEGETLYRPERAELSGSPLVLKLGKMNAVVHGGQVWVGSTSRRQAHLAACQVSAGDATRLQAIASAQLGVREGFSTRWGVRGRYRDRCPAFGSLKWANFEQQVWVAAGFYKNGLQLAGFMAPYFAHSILAPQLSQPGRPSTGLNAFPHPLVDILSHTI